MPAIPGIVFYLSTAMENTMSVANGATFSLDIPPTGAGNCLVVFVQLSAGQTISGITDDKGNTWTQEAAVSGAAQLYCFIAPNCAAGTTKLTFTVGTGGGNNYQVEYSEWYNVLVDLAANVTRNTSSAASQTGTTVATAGSVGAAGDLILQKVATNGGTPNTSFTHGAGFKLVTANVQCGKNKTTALFATSSVQSQIASGAVTPSVGLVGGTSQTSDTLAIALKPAPIAGGTPPAAGIRVAGVQNCCIGGSISSLNFQFPHVGNLMCLTWVHDHTLSSMTDSDGNTWNNANNTTVQGVKTGGHSYAKGVSQNDSTTATITWSGLSGNNSLGFCAYYDIVGADPANPMAQYAFNNGTQSVNANLTFFDGVTGLKPRGPNHLFIIDNYISFHTTSGLVAPTSANGGRSNTYDFPLADDTTTQTCAEDDDWHGFWYNGAVVDPTAFTVSINPYGTLPTGVGDWTVQATEFQGVSQLVSTVGRPKQRYQQWTYAS